MGTKVVLERHEIVKVRLVNEDLRRDVIVGSVRRSADGTWSAGTYRRKLEMRGAIDEERAVKALLQLYENEIALELSEASARARREEDLLADLDIG